MPVPLVGFHCPEYSALTAPFFTAATLPFPGLPLRLRLPALALVPAPQRIPMRLLRPRKTVTGVADPLC